MLPETTDTPLKAGCPSATCSRSSDTPETDAVFLRENDDKANFENMKARCKRIERQSAARREMLIRADNLILRAIVMVDGWADAEQWHNDVVDLQSSENVPTHPRP